MDDCCYKGKKEIVVTVVVFLFHYFLVELHHFRFEFSSFQFCRVFCTLCLQISAFEDAWMNVVSWGHSLRTSPGCVPLGREGQWQNSAVLGILSQPQSNVNKPGPLNESFQMKLQNYPKFVFTKFPPTLWQDGKRTWNHFETKGFYQDGHCQKPASLVPFDLPCPCFLWWQYKKSICFFQSLFLRSFSEFPYSPVLFVHQKQWKSIHHE